MAFGLLAPCKRERSIREQQERDESMLIETLGRDKVQIDND